MLEKKIDLSIQKDTRKIKEWDTVVKLIHTDNHREGEKGGMRLVSACCKDFVDITVLVTMETLWGIDHLTAFISGNKGLGSHSK